MKIAHAMPFGAQPSTFGMNDPVRFRLWAPTAKSVELLIRCAADASEHTHALSGDAHGWYEATLTDARAGDRYAYRINHELVVPDPASRFNPEGVHGWSELIDPTSFEWDATWAGVPWQELVIYELHVGAFTPEGTYAAAIGKLDHLAALGVKAIELMPVASASGERGWGYDGVLLFAPQASYGSPDDLKRFIQAAHRLGMAVLLDVVYNHFGPDGNYLHVYAERFFDESAHTPWGAAIAFGAPEAAPVRDFYLHNALYWLTEFQFDGLRFDAVHAIEDPSEPHILADLAARVRAGLPDRPHIHLILENDRNQARWLGRDGTPGFDAQWNDDVHHAFHVLLTGERGGYYGDFGERPAHHLARALAEGFAFQGEPSALRNGETRGEASAHLPAHAFINFLQNHDQIGNRPFGERLLALTGEPALRAALSILLLGPSIPLLFMGEEFGAAQTPFLYFCDYEGELRRAITEGRKREFAGLAAAGPKALPDACDPQTFESSKLDWAGAARPPQRKWLAFYRSLIERRRDVMLPLFARLIPGAAHYKDDGEQALAVTWPLAPQGALILLANLSARWDGAPVTARGQVLYSTGEGTDDRLGPWSVRWILQ